MTTMDYQFAVIMLPTAALIVGIMCSWFIVKTGVGDAR